MTEMEPMGTWDMLWYASKVFLALVVLVPFLYYILRAVGRRMTVNRSIYGNMEVLDILPLGGGKQLLLVRLAETALLLAFSKDRVAFLWEVPEGQSMQRESPQGETKALTGLKQWVDRWRKGQQGDGWGEDS